MLLQKLVFPLCEDDRVLHDMDRSGEKQSQAPGRSCPYLTNLLQRSELSHRYEDLHCVQTLMFTMYWTKKFRMPCTVPFHGMYCGMVYEFSAVYYEMVYEVLYETREQDKT